MWLGDDGYESYLEICTYTKRSTQWMPVCGGEQWTNTEARVACNQLGYPNTTTLGKYPRAINTDVAIVKVHSEVILLTLNCALYISMYSSI